MESSDVTKWRTAVSSENPELLKMAQEELNENPTTRDQDIQKLREMVLADKSLKCPVDDAFYLRFLRARKFDHERALKLIKRYFSVQVQFPDLFAIYRPSLMRHVLNENIQVLLPKCDQLGRKIYLSRTGRWDPNISTMEEQIRLLHMNMEYALTDEAIQVHGMVLIFDTKHFGLTHARHITPTIAKKLMMVIQDCVPARIKEIHAIYEPLIFDVIFQIIKPFFNKKIRSRIHLHGDKLESLHKYIHREYLPEDYGGLLPPIDFDSANEALLAKDDEIAHRFENFGYAKK